MTRRSPASSQPITLLKGEELLYVKEFEMSPPSTLPSSLKELIRLARAHSSDEIGRFGPVLASIASAAKHSDPEFRRYEAVFGRDSLRVALDLLDYYPLLTKATLLDLAQSQGVETNSVREEEPGRIVHEDRDPRRDPVARELSEQRGWGWPYYGSVDATPEFIRTLAAYCNHSKSNLKFLDLEFSGRDGKTRSILNSLEMATDWVTSRLGANHEGLLEFKKANPGGIDNQAWKDSWDSYFHKDGTIASHQKGIASVEVQRVAYDALLDVAELYEKSLGKKTKARELREIANRLRRSIFRHFWTDDEDGYFVLGTDRDNAGRLRQLKIKTSNMGQLLHSRLLAEGTTEVARMRQSVIWHLFSPKLLSQNGIRTLASDEARFRPGAYHNGSVWVWDNYLIAQGLEYHGYYGLARYIEDLLLTDFDATKRLVEFLRGDNDPEHRLNSRTVDVYDHINDHINRIEQPPQTIQAWSAAAMLEIKLRRAHQPKTATDPPKRAFEEQVLQSLALRS